jgi:carbonic anhydrase
MKSFVASAFVAGMAAAAGAGEWDYLQNGRNWGDLCASGVSQSPINFDRRKEEKTHDTVLEVEGYASQNNLQVNVGALPGTASRGNTQYYGYSAIKVDLVSSDKAGHDNISSGTPTMLLRHPGEENAQLWTALQYHFHAPSEHTVNGHAYDAEVHFVHTYTLEGQFPLAVLGVFFQESDCAAIALYDDDVAEGEQPLYLEFETTEAKAKCFEDR